MNRKPIAHYGKLETGLTKYGINQTGPSKHYQGEHGAVTVFFRSNP